MIGVRVEKVEVTSQGYALRALGRVSADENRTYSVIASTDGWVRDVHGSTTGSLVQKDQLMALINTYNTDFYSWQQQYLTYAGRVRQPGTQFLEHSFPRHNNLKRNNPKHTSMDRINLRHNSPKQCNLKRRRPRRSNPKHTSVIATA